MSLRDTLRLIILVGIFSTPFLCLYVSNSMFFPFITGKNFAFRIIVEAIMGAWLLLLFLDASYRPRFSWILGAAGAFLAILALADFLGVNPYKSFWSNYERMEGLITQAHLFLFFIIAGTVLAHEHMWKWYWRTSLGASLIVAVYAFSQLTGESAIHQSSTRLDASFGNATYLAIYCLFHAFIAMFYYFRDGARNSLRWLYLVMAALNFLVMFYTQTRGSLLGFIGGAFLALLLVAIFDRERPELRKYAIGGVIGIIVLIGGFISVRHMPFIQKSETLQRMAAISLTDLTTQSRFTIWKMSWEGFKERPLLGWGQDNFIYVFAKHYNPIMWKQEPWFDRSHDVFFDWLIAGGALGLLAYLSMFLAALYYIWFGKKTALSVIEKAILTGMLAGYFTHNIFVFDNLTSYIVFFAILAFLHSLNAEEAPEEPREERHKGKRHKDDEELGPADALIALVIVGVLTAGMIYYVNIRNIKANIALISAIRPEGILVDDGNKGKKVALGDIIDQDLFGSGEALEQLLQLSMQTLDPRVPEDLRKLFYTTTADRLMKGIESDPENLRLRSFGALFFARFGQNDRAVEQFEKSLALSPTRQSIYVDYATLEMSLGNYQKAEELAKTAYDLDPENLDTGISYISALVYQKKFEAAYGVLKSFPPNSSGRFDTRIVNAYGNMGKYDTVIALVNEKIALGFASGRDYFSLAGAYAQLGQKESAIEAINKGVAVDGSLKDQGDQLIKQIQEIKA